MRIERSSDGQTIPGTGGNELIHGAAGNDRISGGNGIDILFGGEGNDDLSGDAGNDFLYGGKGSDRLSGGLGNDYLKGNAGNDRFVFDQSAGGRDTIADFNKHGTDTIEIKASLASSAAKIIDSATEDSGGNAVLHLGGGVDITLLGIGTEGAEGGYVPCNVTVLVCAKLLAQ